MKSKRDGRSLQMFQIELSDPVEAEAIISNKITHLQTGIIFKVEEFRAPISVQQCYNCQNFEHSAKNCKAKIKCVICGEGHSHKGYPNREKNNQSVLTAKDHMMLTMKGVQLIKTGIPSTCGGQQNRLCLHFKTKLGPASTTPGLHILLYNRSVSKICSQCGHPNRSATCVPLKCPQKTQLTKSQVCVDEFPKQPKVN